MELTDIELHAIDDAGDYWVEPGHLAAHTVSVTVVIPTYQAELTLERAIRSALGQTLGDIEVMVVDDASTDSSWELIRGLQREDPRVSAIRNGQNRGKPVGMNRAIARARGRWIAVLDADDWFHPDRLSALVSIGETEGAHMVADNQFFFDAVAERLVGTAWEPSTARRELTFDRFLAGTDSYRRFDYGMLKPVVRADFISRGSLAYEEGARDGQDYFYLLQFYMLGGRGVLVDVPYYYYTQPFGASSKQWSHARRRRYDFYTASQINERITRASANMLSPYQRHRLRKRAGQLRALEFYFRLKESLATGNVIRAVSCAIRCPRLLEYVTTRACGRLKRICRQAMRRRGQTSWNASTPVAPSGVAIQKAPGDDTASLRAG